jgi:hypothetical protein
MRKVLKYNVLWFLLSLTTLAHASLVFEEFYTSVEFNRKSYKFKTPKTFGTTGTFLTLETKNKNIFSFSSLGFAYDQKYFEKKCDLVTKRLKKYSIGDVKQKLFELETPLKCEITRTVKGKLVEVTSLFFVNQTAIEVMGLSQKNNDQLLKEFQTISSKVTFLESKND